MSNLHLAPGYACSEAAEPDLAGDLVDKKMGRGGKTAKAEGKKDRQRIPSSIIGPPPPTAAWRRDVGEVWQWLGW
jgi:hypothetical protein